VHKFELGEYSLAKRKPRFHGGVKAPPNGRPGQPIPATISSIKSIEFSVRQDTLYRTHTLQFWPAQHDWIRRYFVFERATYALEAVKMSRNNRLNNSISLARSGVRYTPRSVVLGGMPWMSGGIGRWSSV